MYQHSSTHPYHLSVGAVLFNEKMEVCLHYYEIPKVAPHLRYLFGKLETAYTLMRETVENNETLEQALLRGLEEEFGATGIIEKYLGSIECEVVTPNFSFQKTTLYHAVRLVHVGDRMTDNEENSSQIMWLSAADALHQLQLQVKHSERPELHESVVLERFIQVYG